MSCPYNFNFVHVSITENYKNIIFRYDNVNLTFYYPKINEELDISCDIIFQDRGILLPASG